MTDLEARRTKRRYAHELYPHADERVADLVPMGEHQCGAMCRKAEADALATAAPLIEARVREQVAAEIEAERDRASEHLEDTGLVGFRIRIDTLTDAVRIARGVPDPSAP